MKKGLGKLFIISGPSQVGKNAIAKKLAKIKKLNLYKITTTTTRPRRTDDTSSPYHFVSKSTFLKMIKDKKFLEWAKVHNDLYGTNKQPTLTALKKGLNVILVIDVQGAKQIKKIIPTTAIFITAESNPELRRRIFESSHIPNRQKKSRWHSALKELNASKNYDYIVVNHWGKLNTAVDSVKKIILKNS